jgi:hypothetical protein
VLHSKRESSLVRSFVDVVCFFFFLLSVVKRH